MHGDARSEACEDACCKGYNTEEDIGFDEFLQQLQEDDVRIFTDHSSRAIAKHNGIDQTRTSRRALCRVPCPILMRYSVAWTAPSFQKQSATRWINSCWQMTRLSCSCIMTARPQPHRNRVTMHKP